MSTQFRIMDTNLAFSSATVVTYSSQDANFPVTNLKKYLRSRVWRSNATGSFVIDATNNKIDFKHNGGAQLTATPLSGTYTSTTLAAEIVSKMNTAAGGSFYTVTKGASTGLWTIVSSGAAFQLLFATGTSVAASIASTLGFAASDRTGALTYTSPNIAIHTSEWVVWDILTSENIDSFAMIFDSTTGPKFSSTAVLTLQANATNIWTSPAVSQVVTVDATYDCVTKFFTSAQSYRYWRLKIVDPRNSNLCVEVGKVFLSAATQLTQGPSIGFGGGDTDRSVISETSYGHRYSDIYPTLRTASFSFESASGTDLATLQAIRSRLGAVVPLCVALDPTETLWDKDRFFLFGYMAADFAYQQAFLDYFNFTFMIEERS